MGNLLNRHDAPVQILRKYEFKFMYRFICSNDKLNLEFDMAEDHIRTLFSPTKVYSTGVGVHNDSRGSSEGKYSEPFVRC